MKKAKIIDHLVYAVPDLEQAMDSLEDLLGIRPVFGGYHSTQGTKNALLHLGNECYLEILAIDENNTKIQAPRWMGIDFISNPVMTRWCLKSDDIEKDSLALQKHYPAMGKISEGQRRTSDGQLLNWEMTLPLAKPTIALEPFLINWGKDSIHPTKNLEEKCQLIGLVFTHPKPNDLSWLWQQLNINFKIKKGENVAISAQIASPNGLVLIE